MEFQVARKFRRFSIHYRIGRYQRGFSLIELLIVIAIVVILGVILVTVFTKTWKLIQSWQSDAASPPQQVAMVLP